MSLFPFLLVLCSTGIHAVWNLLAHSRRANPTFFLQLILVIAIAGAVPALLAQFAGKPMPASVWGLAVLSGAMLAVYYLGLTMGYRNGEFSLVYPMARSLPVLMLAGADALRGRMPSMQGWTGITLVTAGCLLAPQRSLRTLTFGHYWNATIRWILCIAVGTFGYSIVDKIAAERLPWKGPGPAIQYGAMQFLFSVPFLWILLHMMRQRTQIEMAPRSWRSPAIGAILTFVAYALVLWAYQWTAHASYVVAVRQLSVVLGLVGARVLFKEPLSAMRIAAVILLVTGVLLTSLSKG